MVDNGGWKSKEAARRYQRTADILIPNRKDILSIIARLAIMTSPGRLRVLDLGCGTGDVTAEILKLNPDASVSAVDFSDEMIHITRSRFSDNKNVETFKHDLNIGIPDVLLSREFDAVVSCFALHHIELKNRVYLYTQIKNVLVKRGVFVNGDRFIEDSPVVTQWQSDNWIHWMVEQIRRKLGRNRTFDEVKRELTKSDSEKGDKPGTIWEMRDDLIEAGFKYVDCEWKSYTLGVIVATNG